MLDVQKLKVSYGGVKALHGISLQVSKGEFVALVGNNGAGKTTTLNAICGVVRPREGTIVFEGETISGLSSDKIASKGIAMVPEGRRVFAGMSVQENLDMGAFMRRDKDGIKRDLEMVFEMFPILKERRRQQAGTLSGGEQQMLAIGRGLMSNPRLLFLDEPSLGLAPVIVENIFKIIKQINRQGISILMVEQNVPLSLSVADRAYVLETGNIVLEGSSDELMKNDLIQQVYLGMVD
ncbi:ABC transporter ATP-binding protein [Zhaonella formicivorans]|uniref:ABC transporter ATP-binding protein n=1 Tax=Zhaonella formicivorans TaxID=2528593 RepID=UPI0010F3C285|nr:ABC transporter ATP-binding protein [Zhaonella formicivorans]